MLSSIQHAKNLMLFNICYQLKTSRAPYPPLLVNLEPTNFCNLRCPMCPVSQNFANPLVRRGLMEMDLFERIVAELAPMKPRVSLNMGGESTLHPELATMVRKLKAAGLYVFIDTNATRLTPELGEDLIKAGIDKVVLCLDGSSKETYQGIRVRAKFDDTIANIRTFLEIKQRLQSTTPYTVIKNIQYYDPEQNPGFPKQFAELFHACPPDEFRFTWADYWPGTHRYLLKDPYQAQPFGDEYSACINLWKMLPISWDGMIYICCLDLNRTTPVGSVQESGILGTWNSPVMQHFRRMHASGRQAELSLCANCNQIRRPAPRPWTGLLKAGESRFTPWIREYSDSEQPDLRRWAGDEGPPEHRAP
jgi:wyosine [tRNA(Phe)-imidazoG37] synthetase (radical SAM superfamily)